MSKKTLEELVFHDDFMFAAVMMDAENCRCFLERVLEIQIERVEISTEHGFFFNPECKSIRMDVFAKDENRTHYDIEMQLVKKDSLEKRSRYYHSQMDVKCWKKEKLWRAGRHISFSFVTLIPGAKKCVIPSADTVKKREMYLVTESALFFLIQMEKIVRKYQRNW
ncbi:MAG: Rpn family recombination-promoting nuclease/putative transposase [Clostridium sp.]